MTRVAVYTAIIGDYERPSTRIVPEPVFPADGRGSDVFRFTDSSGDPGSTTSPIEVRVTPRVPGDSIRSARAVKILGHPRLATYGVTVWIDNRIRLKVTPDELVERFLPSDCDIALPLHSFHSSLAEEFDAVLGAGLDDPRRVREQRSLYSRITPGVFGAELAWTALLIRRNNPVVSAFNERWWEQVLRFSRRDQLSFPYVREMSGDCEVALFPLDSSGSEFHEWRDPSDVGRQWGAGRWSTPDLRSEFVDAARFFKSSVKRINEPGRYGR